MQFTKCTTISFDLHSSIVNWFYYNNNVRGAVPDAGEDKQFFLVGVVAKQLLGLQSKILSSEGHATW